MANIVCKAPALRGRGGFWKFLDALPAILLEHRPKEYTHIFIESVVNSQLAESLSRRGWGMLGDDFDKSPSFWKAI